MRESIYAKGSVSFVPTEEKIEISLGKLNYVIRCNVCRIMYDYQLKERNTLNGYMLIVIIAHEIEHVYQYLMGKKQIVAPNDVLANAYQGLFDLVIKNDQPEIVKRYL